MHEAVLNDGRGPMLKVLLAEAPNARCCTAPAAAELSIAGGPASMSVHPASTCLPGSSLVVYCALSRLTLQQPAAGGYPQSLCPKAFALLQLVGRYDSWHGCCARRLGPSRSATELDATLEASLDPDNIPPRSRLFLVVPKNADGQSIEVRCCASC